MKPAKRDNNQKMVYGNANEIANRMQNGDLIEDGGHNLLVYNDLDGLRQIFTSYAEAFLPKNEIIVFATQYDSIDNIKRFLQDSGINISKHLADGTLFIIDAQEGYHGADTQGVIKLAMSLVSRVKKENRRGVTVFGDIGSFFAFGKIGGLVDFELSFPTKYEDMMKTLCCYHRADFKNLDEEQQDALFRHHYKSIIVE